MGKKTCPQWLACLRYPFKRLSCPFNANITGWPGPKLVANRKSLLILVFPNDAEEFSIFPLSSLLRFLRVFTYIVGLRFFTRSMNRDNQCMFYRKCLSVSGELLAVLASHALARTLECDIVQVFKHKSVWWLSIVIDGFIHADETFFFFALPFVLWRLMHTLKLSTVPISIIPKRSGMTSAKRPAAGFGLITRNISKLNKGCPRM